MVSKQDLKALRDSATGSNGAHIDAVQGIHQLQQIYTGFIQPQLHGSRSVPVILGIGSRLPFIGHVGPNDLKPVPSPGPSPTPSPTATPKHSPTPSKKP